MSSIRFFILAIALVVICSSAQTSFAADFMVLNTNDSGPGSLRQAVLDSNVNGADDVISFDPTVFNVPRTILLTSGEIVIQLDNPGGTVRTTTINGPGANLLELNGNNNSRIIYVVQGAMLTIDAVKMSGGNGFSNGVNPGLNASGGALRVDGGAPPGLYALRVTNCIISNNSATVNIAGGGGLVIFGRALIVNTAIINNQALFGGGFSMSGEVRMYNSTVSGNSAQMAGGIDVGNGNVNMTNSTVVRNQATAPGAPAAGINLAQAGPFSTGDLFSKNSIVAKNVSVQGPQLDIAGSGRIFSQGNNILGTVMAVSTSTPTDLFNVDPQIDSSLSTHGGIIPSHALRAGSPAIDSGDNCALTTTAAGGCSEIAITHDHRGVVRPQDADANGSAVIDRGTFEVTAAEIAIAPGAPDLHAVDDSGTSNTDNVTNIPDVTVDVGGLTVGATVELLRNDVPIANTIASGTTLTFNDTLTVNGTYVYTARQTVGGVTSLQGGSLFVVFDTVAPTGTLVQAVGQADPTRLQPINFTLTFSEQVVGFEAADVTFAGSTANTSSANIAITGSAPTFSLGISNITADGTVVLGMSAAGVQDVAGNSNAAIAGGDNTVTLDTTPPMVTINQAAAQVDPARFTPLNFTVTFSEPVTGFTNSDVSLAGSTANVASASRTVSGSGPTYNVAIGGVNSNGATVVASILAASVQDAAGNASTASTSTDNTVTLDNVPPTVTINQAVGQPDPTNTLPVNFTVVFSEPVTGLDSADISLSGSSMTTTGASITVSGSGTTYSVGVGNISSSGGFIRASVRSGAAVDVLGNSSFASTSTDNAVTIDTVAPNLTVNQAISQADPTYNQPINFTAVFSELVSGFQSSDVSLAGSTANVSSANVSVTGSGSVYTISVSGVSSNGQVVVSVPSGAAQDGVGNASNASTSSDNSVTVLVRKTAFDFDGDGKTDVGIFRPSSGQWWINRSSTGQTTAGTFGASTDMMTPADFTGDGKTDIAFYRPSTGFWFVLRSEDFSYFSLPFGTTDDVPVPADFDADGKADLTVFRPSTSTWYIRRSSDGGTTIQGFGSSGDVPVPADYDGDGKADVAIYRPSSGQWWISRSSSNVLAFTFGTATDKPVQGDFTGDGKADAAFWRPTTGVWSILRSEDSSYYSVPFGTNGDIPAPGDYDGDGKFDTTVFRPSTATWYAQRSTAGVLIQQFGADGDRPIPNAFVP
ncbi:MAG TPA: Ig-like domain-containing protein [Pyrinomonadaceae bacterium]|nr:Ig-like domain-containing protein [Pyrinomonadaceae bacterium]